MMGLPLVLLAIIAVNVLFSIKGFDDYSFFERFKFQVGAVKRGEHIRMLSSGFLHVDTMHLAFNMITLYFFSDKVVHAFGAANFIILYCVSLLGGNLLSLAMHKNEYQYSAVGASGAVTGVLYAAIILDPQGPIMIPRLPGYVFGALYLLYSIYGMKKRIGNIGHSAHFGGAVAGYITTLIFRPGIISTDPFILVVLAVPIVILFVLERFNKI